MNSSNLSDPSQFLLPVSTLLFSWTVLSDSPRSSHSSRWGSLQEICLPRYFEESSYKLLSLGSTSCRPFWSNQLSHVFMSPNSLNPTSHLDTFTVSVSELVTLIMVCRKKKIKKIKKWVQFSWLQMNPRNTSLFQDRNLGYLIHMKLSECQTFAASPRETFLCLTTATLKGSVMC